MLQENPAFRFVALLEQRARADNQWREQEYSVGSSLFEPMQDEGVVCVLRAGLVKLYYPVENGEEWTKSFIADRGVFGPSAPDERIVRFGARAIERTVVAKLPPRWVSDCLAQFAELSTAFADFQAWLFARKREREEDLLCLSAEERYLKLVRSEANLMARLEQQEIAAYLRITPVALSRIRRRLKGEGRLSPTA